MSKTIPFAERLRAYKQAIDDDIASYAVYARESARLQFGTYAGLEVDTFMDMVSRGGKRIRGALVLHAYKMCGGTDQGMIIQAARAIEMLHAYMLILDDIQDRAAVRRGKPSVHAYLADYHRKHGLRGDADYSGLSLALNVAIAGSHAAQMILANVNADPQLRLNVLSITNRTLMITAHGQMYDVMNELVERPNPEDIDRVMEWKTALYSFINPLHVGMVLAGAGCQDTDAITPYGLHTGKAFQITDDILGIFGNAKELGKSPMDDIREGKETVLIHYALAHVTAKDAVFLRGQLGNQRLSVTEFSRCQEIVRASGAIEYARQLTTSEGEAAIAALNAAGKRWDAHEVQFLRDLTMHIITRTA